MGMLFVLTKATASNFDETEITVLASMIPAVYGIEAIPKPNAKLMFLRGTIIMATMWLASYLMANNFDETELRVLGAMAPIVYGVQLAPLATKKSDPPENP